MLPEPPKEATPEQKKLISKILLKARLSIVWIGMKFSFGLFFANLFSLVLGAYILKDVDTEVQAGFNFVSLLTNVIFMSIFLSSQMKKNTHKVSEQIKEVLKK